MRWLCSLAFLLVAFPAVAAPIAFVDVDSDGIYTPGVDEVIPIVADPADGCLRVTSDQDLVFPKGSIPATRWQCVFISTPGHLTLDANALVKMTAPSFGGNFEYSIWVKGKAGMRTGPNVTLEGPWGVYVGSNFGTLHGGTGNRYTSKYGYLDVLSNDIVGFGKLIARACTRIQFDAATPDPSTVDLDPGLNAIVSCQDEQGFVAAATGAMSIRDAAQIQAQSVFMRGQPLTLTDSTLKGLGPFSSVFLADYILNPGVVPMGPVDLRGTSFQIEPFIIGQPVRR
jgi:hypothetical protein